MNEGVALIAEVERWRIDKRIETRYCDTWFENIDAAIDRSLEGKGKKRGLVHCCLQRRSPARKTN